MPLIALVIDTQVLGSRAIVSLSATARIDWLLDALSMALSFDGRWHLGRS